jgi:hypothetical protein
MRGAYTKVANKGARQFLHPREAGPRPRLWIVERGAGEFILRPDGR